MGLPSRLDGRSCRRLTVAVGPTSVAERPTVDEEDLGTPEQVERTADTEGAHVFERFALFVGQEEFVLADGLSVGRESKYSGDVRPVVVAVEKDPRTLHGERLRAPDAASP